MTTEIVPTPSWTPHRGESYAELAATAAVVPGGDLIAGDLLVGVPFVITAMTFRTGDYLNAATQVNGAYVTCEILTGDDAAFAKAAKRGRIGGDCPVDPGEELVFNEGGTGAYRQAVRTWEGLGWIVLPEGPEGGTAGASRLDTPLSQWTVSESVSGLDIRFDLAGNPVLSAPVRLLCPRGLRVSEYQNEYTKEGRTRYFA